MRSDSHAAAAGVDAVALKPAEHDWRRIDELDDAFGTVTIDYEGREHLPDFDALADLASDRDVRLTTPVRADGFDPLGDDSLAAEIPDSVGRVLVAGHGAYLSEEEASRAIAPRLGAAVDADGDAWVGTEGVERAALATGAAQFELLSRGTERDVRSLRAAGFDGGVAVYAPTVLTGDENEILDAVGAYAARRKPVARALPDGAETDATASGRAREVLSKAVRDFALVGDASTVSERVSALRDAGADYVVAYPAAGLDGFC
ncbi:luciferase [Halobacterium litoreum]|nr:luciferase [Halobacterium litoreum]UHH12760.1 luciferase [Halobacterium litoreum]